MSTLSELFKVEYSKNPHYLSEISFCYSDDSEMMFLTRFCHSLRSFYVPTGSVIVESGRVVLYFDNTPF